MKINIHYKIPIHDKKFFLKRKLFLGFTFGMILFMTSCDHRTVYQHTLSIEEENWDYNRPLMFEFSIADTVKTYDIVLTLEHQAQYRFQNVYTKIRTSFPNGEKVDQVVSLQLSDGKGQWLGNCRGDKCTIELNLQKEIKFPTAGAYSILLEQYSREQTLDGILSVGLAILHVK